MKIIYSILFFVLFFILHSPIGHAANQYFVSTNGNDKNDGSYNQPFKSIQYAINKSQPGDTVSIIKGTYYELLTIHNFGTPSTPKWLTIQAIPNESVIIDGSKRNHSDEVGVSIKNSHFVKIKGLDIKNIIADDRDSYPAGILVRGHSTNLQIINNKIHDLGNFHVSGNAHGIIIYGNSSRPIENIKIRKNKLFNLTLGRSETLTLTGNVKNFLIDQNRMYNNNNIGIDIAGHYDVCTEQGCVDQARNGIISNNQVKNHSSANNEAYKGSDSAAGIYIDGGSNIKILNNYVSNNDFGISIASENRSKLASNVTLQKNKITNNRKAGLILGGSKTNNGGASNIIVKENYFSGNDKIQNGYKEVTLQQNLEAIQFQQNQYSVCSYNHYVNNESKTKISISYKKEIIRTNFSKCGK